MDIINDVSNVNVFLCQSVNLCINIITLLSPGFIIVAVLPVFLTITRYNWDVTCGQHMGCKCLMNYDLIPDTNTNNSS